MSIPSKYCVPVDLVKIYIHGRDDLGPNLSNAMTLLSHSTNSIFEENRLQENTLDIASQCVFCYQENRKMVRINANGGRMSFGLKTSVFSPQLFATARLIFDKTYTDFCFSFLKIYRYSTR